MRYVIRDGELVPRHLAPRTPVQRSAFPCPAIRTDGMADTINPANGLLYDSRSAYERAVRDAGCVIVGDDSAYTDPKPPEFETVGGVEHDIKDAIEQLGGL